MVKKTPKKNSTDEMVKRLSFVKWFATILFFCVVIHLAYIQFVQGEELKRKATLYASLKLEGNLGAAKIIITNKGKSVARNNLQ